MILLGPTLRHTYAQGSYELPMSDVETRASKQRLRYVLKVDGSNAGSQEHSAVIPAAGALLQDTGTARED